MSAVNPLPRRQVLPSSPRPAPRPTTDRPRPTLRAIPGGRARRTAATIISALAALALAVGVLGIVALNAVAAEASFEAKALESELSELTLRHDDLVASVAQLESPMRVRDVAIGQLGLMVPEVPGFLVVDAADMPTAAAKPRVDRDN